MKRIFIGMLATLTILWLFGLLTPTADKVNDALPPWMYHPGGLFGIGGSDSVLEVDKLPDMYENHRYPVKVISVHDGDTLNVEYANSEPIKVRLAGIDAPELAQPRGDESLHYLNALVAEVIYIEPVGYDKYDRLLAVLWGSPDSDESINRHMVWGGMAYRYMTNDESLSDAESNAMIAGRGVWQDDDAMRPSDWRVTVRTHTDTANEL